MQFKVNDDIVDHYTFLHVYHSHLAEQFTNKHYNDDCPFKIGTFLAMFQDMVEKNDLKQAAEDAEDVLVD